MRAHASPVAGEHERAVEHDVDLARAGLHRAPHLEHAALERVLARREARRHARQAHTRPLHATALH